MTEPAPAATGPEKSDTPDSPQMIDSRDLFGDAREVRIVHGSEVYRLRITLNNRLILQK